MTIYISADIETNGTIAGLHSMLSLGAVAFNAKADFISTFETNLIPDPDLTEERHTMNWWKLHPEAYEIATKNPIEAKEAASNFITWYIDLQKLDKEVVLVCHNAPFDFSFIRYWLFKAELASPFFSAMDTRMLAWQARINKDFNWIHKKAISKALNIENPMGHTALEDAIEQAKIFVELCEKLGIDL